MKVRTKLVLLLSGALVVILVASTLLRIRLTRVRMEDQLRQSARDTADVIAAELSRNLTPDKVDDEDVAEELSKVKLRHPIVDYLKLTLDTDEDTKTFSLAPEADQPLVAKKARRAKLVRDDVRRALFDHGETGRRPGMRVVEPMWWTADKPGPDRWPMRQAAPQPKVTRTFDLGERRRHTVLEEPRSFHPDGPLGKRHGTVVVVVSGETIDSLERVVEIYSLFITGGALMLLVLLTTVIANRVVGRPVAELEKAMKRVEGGALDARVEARRPDEIGALSAGFNDMVARLAEADAEIRAFNRRLADEVRSATEDLQAKNLALGQLNRLLVEARRQIGDKERLAALGQLAAQLAHEIGTPLASVSGHLQLAIGGRDVPAPLKERLSVAGSELQRVSKIVRDYLDSTRSVQPERVDTDVRKVVEEAVGIVQGDDRRATIPIRRASTTLQMQTDPGLLRQILVNLLTNAADAVAQANNKGTVDVTFDRSEQGEVVLSVRDEGVGISAEDAARIFEPFYTTKGRGKGTGLGLAICRELATAMGARIAVESAPGLGSTFTLTFPVATGRPAERESASA